VSIPVTTTEAVHARTPTDHRPVLVGTEPGRPGTAVVAWAAAEALRRDAPLLVLPRVSAARAEPADTAVVVVDATAPGLEDLVTTARCPTVAVPPDATAVPGRPVVLALGPRTGPEVIGFAIREAEARGVALHVVRTWDDPTVDLGRPLPAALARWDEADERCRREVADRLAGPVRAHAGVDTVVLVVHESGAEALPAFAVGAPLLVMGQPAGAPHRSTALAALRDLPCPVAVVPSPP
jgi:hypothetical protein